MCGGLKSSLLTTLCRPSPTTWPVAFPSAKVNISLSRAGTSVPYRKLSDTDNADTQCSVGSQILLFLSSCLKTANLGQDCRIYRIDFGGRIVSAVVHNCR